MRRFLIIVPLIGVLTACGGGGGDGGQQLQLPRLEWTWVDVPGTVCSDGTPTGIAVNPGPEGSTDVLVFLNGGGACWDAFTCNTLGTATPGPYGAAQFNADRQASKIDGTILDRTVEGSPFGGATLVFIPYCTGDVHWGDAGTDYGWRHRGARNLAADTAWLAENLPAPGKLIVSGSSAGGFGSLLAHDLLRTQWPDAKGYLIDDSGPPFVGSDINAALRASWYLAWGLDGTLGKLCPDCFEDLSQAIEDLQKKYPADRIALLSTRQDEVIRSFFGFLSPEVFEAGLLELVDRRFTPAVPDHAEAFLVPGQDHALFQHFAAWSADGTPLPDWIGQMVQDDPGWSTLGREAAPPAATAAVR